MGNTFKERQMSEIFGDFTPKPERDVPKNTEGLTAVEIIGRCSKCSAIGTLEYPRNAIPPSQVDKILAYKPIPGVRCLKCREVCEFLPVEVKKYPDLPFLRTVQDAAIQGIPEVKGSAGGNGEKKEDGRIILP